jgi:TatD DNase family protein
VRHVAEEIARLRGIAFEEVARATTENFFRLFRHARPA